MARSGQQNGQLPNAQSSVLQRSSYWVQTCGKAFSPIQLCLQPRHETRRSQPSQLGNTGFKQQRRWRHTNKAGTETNETITEDQWQEKKEHRRQKVASPSTEPRTDLTCDKCNSVCGSKVGLYSHRAHCRSTPDRLSWRMFHCLMRQILCCQAVIIKLGNLR